MHIEELFTKAQIMDQPRAYKENVVHLHNVVLFTPKQEWNYVTFWENRWN
jgi:hypothetical protein